MNHDIELIDSDTTPAASAEEMNVAEGELSPVSEQRRSVLSPTAELPGVVLLEGSERVEPRREATVPEGMIGRACRMAPSSPSSTRVELFVLNGEIDLFCTEELTSQLLAHLARFGPELQIDLSGVSFIDSAGLGMLVGVLKEAWRQGGHATLLNPNQEIQRLLHLTSLDRMFRVERLELDGL